MWHLVLCSSFIGEEAIFCLRPGWPPPRKTCRPGGNGATAVPISGSFRRLLNQATGRKDNPRGSMAIGRPQGGCVTPGGKGFLQTTGRHAGSWEARPFPPHWKGNFIFNRCSGRWRRINGKWERKKVEAHYRLQREWTLKKRKNKGMKTSLSALSREGGRGARRPSWDRAA